MTPEEQKAKKKAQQAAAHKRWYLSAKGIAYRLKIRKIKPLS